MKKINRKTIFITCIVCLLTVFLGMAFRKELPDTIAIHFGVNGEPDGFAPKDFVVFGIPVIMALFQAFCCIVTDIQSHKHGGSKKFEKAAKWVSPFITVIFYSATLGYALGWDLDMRKIACFIVGAMFIVLGNYLPKLDYIKNYKIDPQKARKINRFSGFTMVIMGIVIMITIFLPPVVSVIGILLLIPYSAVMVVYTIRVIRK